MAGPFGFNLGGTGRGLNLGGQPSPYQMPQVPFRPESDRHDRPPSACSAAAP